MHIADIGKGMLGANGIVGGGPPLVCGAALAAKVTRSKAVARLRAGGGPEFIHIEFTRYFGHFEGDQMTYRPPGEVREERNFLDCLKFLRARLISSGQVDALTLDRIEADVTRLVDVAVAEARASAPPEKAELLTDVYKTYAGEPA